MRGDTVRTKKYFYLLRPILAVIWLERGLGLVPTEFDILVERLVEDRELKLAIEKLLTDKRAGAELGHGPRIEVVSEFVEGELGRFEREVGAPKPLTSSVEPLNELFHQTLAEVWS